MNTDHSPILDPNGVPWTPSDCMDDSSMNYWGQARRRRLAFAEAERDMTHQKRLEREQAEQQAKWRAEQEAEQESACEGYECQRREAEHYEAECDGLLCPSEEMEHQESSYIREQLEYQRDEAVYDEMEYVRNKAEREKTELERAELERAEYEWPYCGEEEPQESAVCFDGDAALADQEEALAGNCSFDAVETIEAPPYFSDMIRSSYHLTPVRLEGKYGYIDANGILVIPAIYDDACLFTEEDHALVRAHGVWTLIDASGNTAEPAPWEEKAFDIHLRLVAIEDKWYYKWGFEWNDEIVLPAIYDDAHSFSDGRAAVCIADKWGYIDSNGFMVVPVAYDEVAPFSEGHAAVRVGTKWTYIDLSGAVVMPAGYGQRSSGELGSPETNNGWASAQSAQGLAIQAEADRTPEDAGREAAIQEVNDRQDRAAHDNHIAELCENTGDSEDPIYPTSERSEEDDYQEEIDDQDCSYYEPDDCCEPPEQSHSNDWEDDS